MKDEAAPFTPDAATRAQIGAADPAGSVWLAANAGSGKTRVLTDRVAWLLLERTPPERILCLTYTKAAAGEMQNRLFARLSEWAMLSDDRLREEITRLGAARGTISSEQLRHARTLFARAIETPGGLKIQTIHAFCASLLRRFPLEAGVSPAFAEMDETATARLHAEVLDEMGADPATRPLVDAVGRRISDAEPSGFLAQVAGLREALARPLDRDRLRAALGIADESREAVLEEITGDDTLDIIESLLGDAEDVPGKTFETLRAGLRDALAAGPQARFDRLTGLFLTAARAPRSTGRWPKAVREGDHGPLEELFNLLALRLADAHARIAAFVALEQTEALHAFGPAFLARVGARKAARGWLDFDDLIAGAKRLLTTSPMAQWVLFRLDGGIDHILVDEAQDTSPDQWQVIRRLAAEFGAGLGARPDVRRTIFVVGDRKQSIYAFQGADLAAFDRMHRVFGEMLPEEGPQLREHALLHSFRSSPAILDLVDATFAEGGGVGAPPEHIAFFADRPGRIDLWPAIPKEKDDNDDRLWHEPMDRPASDDADVILADRIADAIEDMLAARVPVGQGDRRRPVRPGDILILLQRRGALFHHIVRACKKRGLDLAGADRLRLSDDLAVRDLIAALAWADTPQDDLSLACILRSPLCGLSEQDLFALAHGRRGRLWDALRDSDHVAAAGLVTDILRVADILRPYEILERILVKHDGRRRLIGRLGPESAEAIDALLGQALAYETLETPSLTGFLGWLESKDVELKRQPGSGTIRVMTVHGAKGLESPVVILPETMKRQPRGASGARALSDGTPVWMPAKANWSPAMAADAEAAALAEAAERDRLLYVAMTRAENWLIAGAAGEVGDARTDSWYNMIRAGMEAQGAQPHEFSAGAGLRIETGDWSPAPEATATPPAPQPVRPDWLEVPVAPPALVAPRIAPSDLPGAKTLPGEAGHDNEAALRKGTAIHALLEHLPGLTGAERADCARHILALHGDAEAGDPVAAWLAEAQAVLDAPDLAPVFAPGTLSEVPFALPATPDRPAIFGVMDRVIVAPDRVEVVDFKTNALIPDRPEDTPAGLRNQMAAYLEAAGAIWPGRTVTAAILWTAGPRLMVLPHEVVTPLDAAIDPVPPPA
ncbi:ATP-dependent helicase/nuclease subunit A [Jannaschia seosinensis]|uniref:DNA 3'-5' helicase n=1 Tax=Jannaschia seosinensis TaxID=313367 RepID=A0A0M7B9S1_9RHOB|nr:double-strand break repair helicase AddA [Jannaschia seosinensis]CUH38818.1 ATP-dependent helicase/nuclease subunit A [Jannaschia seosinensis]